jgi:hypothetical protein
MYRWWATAAIAVAATLLAGCGGGGTAIRSGRVLISSAAVSEGATLVGTTGRQLEATADDVSRLSSQADVPEDVVRTVAPQLDRQTVWQRSVSSARRAYGRVPEELKQPVTSVACQAATGQITTREELYTAVAEEFEVRSMSDDEIVAVIDDIESLYSDLIEARTSADPEQRASAVLFCFTVDELQG